MHYSDDIHCHNCGRYLYSVWPDQKTHRLLCIKCVPIFYIKKICNIIFVKVFKHFGIKIGDDNG